MEAFLLALLPRLLPRDRTFQVHVFQGKRDLLQKLESRLRGYARWLSDDCRIVVMVDRDNDECHALKAQLEEAAGRAGLLSRSRATEYPWQLVNRVVIEELEAWYFGDWDAVRAAYPLVPAAIPNPAKYRDPRRHRGRHLGSARANPETPRLLHDRVAQDGGGAGPSRHSHRPGAQPLAEVSSLFADDHCRGERREGRGVTSHRRASAPRPSSPRRLLGDGGERARLRRARGGQGHAYALRPAEGPPSAWPGGRWWSTSWPAPARLRPCARSW